MSVYTGAVGRPFAILALLFAVLLMPFSMNPAAASTHDHMMASTPTQHCPDQAPNHDMKGGIPECTMACASALPAGAAAVAAPPLIVCEPIRPGAAEPLRGLHPDTATPPPKRS